MIYRIPIFLSKSQLKIVEFKKMQMSNDEREKIELREEIVETPSMEEIKEIKNNYINFFGSRIGVSLLEEVKYRTAIEGFILLDACVHSEDSPPENIYGTFEKEIEKNIINEEYGYEKEIKKEYCTFEDWKKPPFMREKETIYTYPILSTKSEEVVRNFEKYFGRKPSIKEIFALDFMDIAIEAVIKVGNSVRRLEDYLKKAIFKYSIGEIVFNENRLINPANKTWREVFRFKYVDKDGNYRNL